MSTARPPLFNERDRGSTLSQFDLWSYDHVSRHADAILLAVSSGTCPATDSGQPSRSTSFAAGLKAANPRKDGQANGASLKLMRARERRARYPLR